jgi:hypothetical protein
MVACDMVACGMVACDMVMDACDGLQGGFLACTGCWMTVGQLPCGMCPSTRRLMPQETSLATTRSDMGIGIDLRSRWRESTTPCGGPGTT